MSMLEIMLLLAAVQFPAMFSPGPTAFLVLRNAALSGRKGAYSTALGISTSTAVHVLMGVVGVSAIVAQSPVVADIIRYCGAGYLIYLGGKILLGNLKARANEASHGLSEKNHPDDDMSSKRAFGQGFLINLLNPKVIVFYLSLFSQIIKPDTPASWTATFGTQVVLQSILYWSLFTTLVRSEIFQSFWRRWESAVENTFGVALMGFGVRLGFF